MRPPGVTLRSIRPQDREFLFQLYAGTREEELAQTGWTPPQKEAFLQMQFNAQHQFYQATFPAATFDIILLEGQAAGRLYVSRTREDIRIIDIALLSKHCNHGIGSALIRDLLSEAARTNRPVRIHVEQLNPALHLYERLGFRRVEDRGVYWLMEWRAETPAGSPARQTPHSGG